MVGRSRMMSPHNMVMKHLTLFTLVTLTALSFTRRGLAQGVTYLSNLHTPWTQIGIGDIHGVFRGGTQYGSYAAHFTTGAGSFSLNAITLEFIGVGGLQQLRVQLFHEMQSGDVLLGNLGNPVVNPTPTQWPQYTTFFDFSPVQGVNLNAFSRYSVVLSMPASSPTDAGLLFTEPSAYYRSRDGWTMGVTTSGNPYASGEYLVMAVSATPVPEPDTTVVLISGVMILVGAKLIRRVGVLLI